MVTPELTQKLNFLRHVRTMRLHSGNGEPTANPHLPKIVAQLSAMHPQLGLNFFTNGVLLGRKGLIPSLVDGAVSWISVSLNAATRETWSELCRADQFERLTTNLDLLLQEKQARQSVTPVVFGTMVLTRAPHGNYRSCPNCAEGLGLIDSPPSRSLRLVTPPRKNTALKKPTTTSGATIPPYTRRR